VTFADAGIVDYTSPLLAPDWAGAANRSDALTTRDSADRLWAALRHALSDHDVLRIDKMLIQPLDEGLSRINPLALALRPRLQDCEMFGNQFHVADDWDTWRHTLDKRVRKEFERSWRVFTRSPQARFERVTEPQAALQLLVELEYQQSQRMTQLGLDYQLDQPVFSGFYRQALLGGLADGSVVLTALRDGDTLVAAQFGIANRHRYVALRLSMGGDEWKACSPGRLLCEQTARHLHAQGLHWFDFGIGDYRHKHMFGVSHIPLLDGCEALSWRGLPVTWAWRFRRALKRQAWLMHVWRRLQSRHQQEDET
jgi:CelD/BcsL family acetyltransferase involved in cellulose biosynthesis